MLDEQVHVVGHHLQSNDLPAVLVCLGPDQLVEAVPDPPAEDRAAVLGAPHHVQPQAIHTAGKPAKLSHHTHTASIRA